MDYRSKEFILNGSISKGIIKLALPIMGTSFLEMAYNLTDMFWVGTIGSSEVAAVGTAGFITWFMFGIVAIPRTGAAVSVAQAFGRDNDEDKAGYIKSAIQLGILLPLLYGILVILLRNHLLNFFNIADENVVNMAKSYMLICIAGYISNFLNPIFTAIYTASGDSFRPFCFNMVGLVSNMILDPMFISEKLGIFKMGIRGAAYATVIANIIVTVCFIVYIFKEKKVFHGVKVFSKPEGGYIKMILRLGYPSGLQNMFFTVISMILTRFIGVYGHAAIAAQKVTAQVEAISWRTAEGFGTALTTFIGQNYGAGNYERTNKTYRVALRYMAGLGIFASALLIGAPEVLLRPFFHEKEVIDIGVDCMRVMGYSQIFMCFELITVGAFNGFGRTFIPSLVSIVLTGMRWPLAIFMTKTLELGLHGIWWTISISSIAKGVITPMLFYFLVYRPNKKRYA